MATINTGDLMSATTVKNAMSSASTLDTSAMLNNMPLTQWKKVASKISSNDVKTIIYCNGTFLFEDTSYNIYYASSQDVSTWTKGVTISSAISGPFACGDKFYGVQSSSGEGQANLAVYDPKTGFGSAIDITPYGDSNTMKRSPFYMASIGNNILLSGTKKSSDDESYMVLSTDNGATWKELSSAISADSLTVAAGRFIATQSYTAYYSSDNKASSWKSLGKPWKYTTDNTVKSDGTWIYLYGDDEKTSVENSCIKGLDVSAYISTGSTDWVKIGLNPNKLITFGGGKAFGQVLTNSVGAIPYGYFRNGILPCKGYGISGSPYALCYGDGIYLCYTSEKVLYACGV